MDNADHSAQLPLANTRDSRPSLMGFVFLDMTVRLLIWGTSLAVTLAVFARYVGWPDWPSAGWDLSAAKNWAIHLVKMILVFNAAYILCLVLLRLPIPRPRAGRYKAVPGGKLDPQLIWSCLIATLTKARYDAPFPAFLVFHLSNIPPLVWLMNPIFGPKSKSGYIAEPQVLDPHNVTIGRNVVIGFGSIIAAHYQEQTEIVIHPTIIEDDVLIGACAVMSGVHVKKGAIIGAGSFVLPGSVIGPHEYWSGNPCRRRKSLLPDKNVEARSHEG